MELPRLIFVTGKGGSGKSTVAAALAVALARRYPTTIADLDQRFSAARLFGAKLNGAGSARVGERIEVCALSPHRELELFIERVVPLKSVSRRMLRSRTFGYVTAALPGLEGFLLLERLRMMAGEAARADGYVVVDGPATGTALELLSVADSVERVAPAGTLNRLARELREFLVDASRFGAVVALWPEELALREAMQAVLELRRMGVSVVAGVVNGATKPLFTRKECDETARHSPGHAELIDRRITIAEAAERARLELDAAGVRTLELKLLFKSALKRAEVFELGQALGKQLNLR